MAQVKFKYLDLVKVGDISWEFDESQLHLDGLDDKQKQEFIDMQKKGMSAMRKLKGEIFFVERNPMYQGELGMYLYTLFSPVSKNIKIDKFEGEVNISFLEDELELVSDDHLNNCCLYEIFQRGGGGREYICTKCHLNLPAVYDTVNSPT